MNHLSFRNRYTSLLLCMLCGISELSQAAVSDGKVFIRGELNTTSPYVQSQAVYTFKLFYRVSLRDPRIELPQVKDITYLQLADTPNYTTTINGVTYHVIEKHFALFAKKPGANIITPMQLQGFIQDNTISPFDDPFNFDIPKPFTVATKSYQLMVRDVPANYQGTTWLPANNISLEEEWSGDTSHVESGTPLTRTITITAEGLRADQLPDLTFNSIDGVNIYKDRPKRSNQLNKNMVIGIYQQQVTYIPNHTASFTIPALQVNWWNTESDTNASTTLNSVSIKVTGVASVAKPIMPDTDVASQPVAFYQSIWFWAAGVFSLAWMLTFWLLLRIIKKKKIRRYLKKRSDPLPPLYPDEAENR